MVKYYRIIALLFAIIALGCGSVGGDTGGGVIDPSPPISVKIIPDPMLPTLPSDPSIYIASFGVEIQFHAITSDGKTVDSEVNWLAINRIIGEPAGSITQQGLYTAPNRETVVEIGASEKQGVKQTYRGYTRVSIVGS